MVISKATVRSVVLVALAACVLLAVLVATGLVTSPLRRSHVRRLRLWLGDVPAASISGDYDSCGCVWQIGCPRFRWQTNFTSPRFRCGYQPMTPGLVNECLTARQSAVGRPVRLHVAGHVREAFLVDYIQQRLGADTTRQSCRLRRPGPEPKNFDKDPVEYCQVEPLHGEEPCESVHTTDGLSLEYKFVGLLGPDVFSYVNQLLADCSSNGCGGDLLIFSGGAGELLNSTLLDSFTGVRRFQRQYKKLLPMLAELVVRHGMEVVWKIHEPVTDELIPDASIVRNDLLQEYNALIMEQTLDTPVMLWTSHMIMKLHHIEECYGQANKSTINEEQWRCEEEWVAGDRCHSEYFDTIFNKVCENYVSMPENPCCSA